MVLLSIPRSRWYLQFRGLAVGAREVLWEPADHFPVCETGGGRIDSDTFWPGSLVGVLVSEHTHLIAASFVRPTLAQRATTYVAFGMPQSFLGTMIFVAP